MRKDTKIDWDRWDHLVGIDRDVTLAEKIGCGYQAVAARRRKLGRPKAPAHNQKVDWNVWDQFLGVESDSEIARRIGCTKSSVRERRTKLGRDAAPNRYVNFDWGDWEHLMGIIADTEIARRIEAVGFSCAVGSVSRRRTMMGKEMVKNQKHHILFLLLQEDCGLCNACGNIRWLSEMVTSGNKFAYRCSDCANLASTVWSLTNPEVRRATRSKHYVQSPHQRQALNQLKITQAFNSIKELEPKQNNE